MVTLADRRGVALSSAPSPGKPETSENFINRAALHRGDANELVISLLKGWLWVSQRGIPGTVSCRGTSGRQLCFRKREDFSETALR